MKTKIVYCLISDSNDYFYEQLLISLCSLRVHNPNVLVEVVCDNATFNTFIGNRRGIFNYNIHTVVVETPEGWEKWERSRYLKTNLRMLTKGDYLYIDTDTVICSSLDFIDTIPYSVAAVNDSHVERPLPSYSQRRHDTEKWIWGEAKKANVDITGLCHYNSGVMFVKETEKAYELYSKWAEKYRLLLGKGVRVDQLPLLLVNKEMGDIISPLEPSANCQVSFKEGRERLSDAHIIHYFPGQGKTILSSPWLLDPIKESGEINISIRRIIDDPYAFFSQESLIIWGDEVELIKNSLLEVCRSNCKVVYCFVTFMKIYQKIIKHLKRLIRMSSTR